MTSEIKGTMKFEAPDWDYLYELCLELAQLVEKAGFKPDLIVGIARGGWIPARLLSDFLLNPNIASIKVEFYKGIGETMNEPMITQDIPVDVRGLKILVVDDVADTGKSLKLVKERLESMGAGEVRVATIYYKPWSIFKPDFYAKTTNAWIIFPHEVREAVEILYRRFKEEGRSIEDLRRLLVEAGLKPLLVDKFLGWIARYG
ncbi:MAG: phosphoribosyltransferase [Nitrososphaerota archaeon]|nr:phosphoribosyltransferase [Nitrososphaerota archaeon]